MNILVIQPGFPAEIPYFVRGLSRMGARVFGVGDQPEAMLPQVAKEGLSAYLQVPQLWDAKRLLQALADWDLPIKIDRVECLWEVGMELTALVRQAFEVPGMSPEQTVLFRDKNQMREALNRGGVRNPRNAKARTNTEVKQFAQEIGFPVIIKPIAGAGSADTYRINTPEELDQTLNRLGHLEEVLIEEFVQGTEFTFDTICANGKILFHNVTHYIPTMLESRSNESVSPTTIVLKDSSKEQFPLAYKLGESVITTLGFQTGFTHSEWFRTPKGEGVFCEIAGRPPGGYIGELINYSCDTDIYNAWAEAIIHGRISQPIERKYNASIVFKRAHGQGRIQKIEGVEDVYQKYGSAIIRHEFTPVGAPRKDWKKSLISDGFMILRHPNYDKTVEISEYIANHVHLYAE